MSKKGYKVSVIFGNGYNYFLSNYFLNEKEAILAKLKTTYLKKVVSGEKMTAKKLQEEYEEIVKMLQAYKQVLAFSDDKESWQNTEKLLQQIAELYKAEEQRFLTTFLALIQKTITQQIGGEIGGTYEKTTALMKAGILPATSGKKNEQPADFLTTITKNIPHKRFIFDLYTTNFDGFIDKFFTSQQNAVNIHELHGRYNEANIIYHTPQAKFSAIKESIELSKRFIYFGNNVPQSDVLILFGCSLKTDPHILAILNRAQPQQLIIIDKEPQKVFGELIDEPIAKRANEIIFIRTEKSATDVKEQEIYATPEKLLNHLISVLK